MPLFNCHIIEPTLAAIQNCSSRNAFYINGIFYTYQEFGRCISKIRRALSNSRYTGNLAGVVANDDLETYASIYALWFEGRAFVPLHPHWPDDRCDDILNQVGTELILDSSESSRYVSREVICTKNLTETEDVPEYESEISDNRLAYILFTSGTTGRPKGVQITRGNLGSFLDHLWRTGIKVDENDRCLQAFDLTFDMSIWSYIAPLCKGACCYTIPDDEIKYVYAAGLIEDHKLTFAPLAPSMLRYLRPYFDEIDASSLKTCIFSAEACPMDLMKAFFKIAKNAKLYNCHGTTETTIFDTSYIIRRDGFNKTLNGTVTLGQPFLGVICRILDENGDILPTGGKGELCIAGSQVTPGYLNDPEKNNRSFFEKEQDGEMLRFYRTGDLCLMDDDGDLMYCGRIDHQAKIQGFRVEMGEIEYHAGQFLHGKNVICLPFENKNGLTEIAMFIESGKFHKEELISYLRTKIPAYMIPTRIIFVSRFELNRNGKIDRKKLLNLL